MIFPAVMFGQQIENPGFENWENAGTVKDEPVDWSTIKTCDDPGIAAVAPITYDRVTDAHSGNYALKLYNVAVFGIIATGAITNGKFHAEYNLDSSYSYTDPSDPRWNTAFTYRPDSLTGWFKFFPKEDDAAQFKLILHVGDCQLPSNGTQDNWIGMAVNVTPRGVAYPEWTRFSVPFTYFSDGTPEYVLNVINSGDSTSAIDSSYLIVDDLQLIYNNAGIFDHQIPESYILSSADKLVIRTGNAEEFMNQWFYLIDIKGQTVLSRKLDNEVVMLPPDFTPGIYVGVLAGKSQQHVQKIIIR
jgi:hypothetical protein